LCVGQPRTPHRSFGSASSPMRSSEKDKLVFA
jgi:hypothetical protein